MSNETSDKRRIWDLPTRVFHWTLALSFFGAYLLAESERVRHIHVMFGYTVLALVVFRLLWGVFGTPYARFRSFAFGPRAALAHVKGLAHRDVPEHAGHTPAGSWAIWAMLALALTTAVTGWLHLNEIGGEALEEVHEVAANVWLLVVFVHVAGVIVSSLVERRNLVISLLNEEHQPVMVWKVMNAFPVKVEGPALKASANEVAIESVELAHEGLELQNE